ncbi:nucleotide exchange factor GrpE [Candidatus Nomurabacteria bacterium]|nr:nucleotide exchange factor GrpE [Candidatus Nomurabacteria bacterium]
MKEEDTTIQDTHEEPIEDMVFEETTEDGDMLPTKDVVKKLREDLKKAREEKQEYLTGWQRAKADYVNLERSEETKRKELRAHITAGFVEDLLPTLDSFDMAFANKEAWEKVGANWRAGVEYIYQQLVRTVEDYGVKKVGVLGEVFNPTIHEAIEMVPTEQEDQDHMVASVIQYGYIAGERIIRPARVKVFEVKK